MYLPMGSNHQIISSIIIQRKFWNWTPYMFLLGLLPLLKTNTIVPIDLINHTLILGIVTIISLCTTLNKRTIIKEFNYLDIFILFGVSYIILQHYLHHFSLIELAYNVTQTLSFAFFYFSIKLHFKQQNETFQLDIIFLIISVCTSVIVLTEIAKQLKTNGHLQFPLSGPMENPGASAGFTAVLLVSTVANLNYNLKIDFTARVKYASIATLLFSLFASESRAALIASLVGISINFIFKQKQILRKSFLILIFILAITIYFACTLFIIKKDSFFGRSFILRRSLELICKNPILGLGPNKFAISYNNIQADYFEKTQLSDKSYVYADVVPYALNEYLQSAIEYGIFGLTILVIIIIKCIRIAKNQNKFNLIEPIIAILILLLFSYPLHTTPTLVLCVFFTGVCSSLDNANVFESASINSFLKSNFSTGLIFTLLVFQGLFIIYLFKWKKAEVLSMNSVKEAGLIYKNLAEVFSFDGRFLLMYGRNLHFAKRYMDSNELLLKSIEIYPNSDSYEYIGFNYLKTGDSTANRYFRRAIALAPSRVFPRYDLMKSYLSFGMISSANLVAYDILRMQIKHPSDETEMILMEAQEIFRMR